MRLAPCALDELLSTLEQAVAEREALQERNHISNAVPATGKRERGQA